jgi:hypothetical protein
MLFFGFLNKILPQFPAGWNTHYLHRYPLFVPYPAGERENGYSLALKPTTDFKNND